MSDAWRTFDRAATSYDATRPAYPEEVFDAIGAYSRLLAAPAVLEIGAGSGQATLQMTGRGWQVVAVEPGAQLAELLRSRSRGQGVDVRVGRFEDIQVPDGQFDLVASATAWHWVDPTVGYPKAARALRAGGVLALWWNAHVPDTRDPRWAPIRRAYEQAAPELATLARLTPDRPAYDPAAEIEASQLFSRVEQHVFPFERSYSADQFLDLIGTYASHRLLDDERRAELHRALRRNITKDLDGRVTKPYEAVVVLASTGPLSA